MTDDIDWLIDAVCAEDFLRGYAGDFKNDFDYAAIASELRDWLEQRRCRIAALVAEDSDFNRSATLLYGRASDYMPIDFDGIFDHLFQRNDLTARDK